MPQRKTLFNNINKSSLQTAGILLLILLAVALFWYSKTTSYQASNAMAAQVRFEGEYRIGDVEWQPITDGQHISATKGDVTLRGKFHMLAPDGEYVGIYDGDTPIAFYLNHISVAIREGESECFEFSIDGPADLGSICGVSWQAYPPISQGEELIEIAIYNPHSFGNETAIDELLSGMALWSGLDFEKDIMESGQAQRNTGLFFVIVAFVLLGSALFSALLRIQNNRIIWVLGASILSAGVYLAYNAPGISLWSKSIAGNTIILGLSMMF